MDASWVDRLHTRLLARYGTAWVRKWDGVDAGLMKADWAEVLHGITADGVRYALENLPPDNPPNATQFRAICLAKPASSKFLALPEKRKPPTPEQKAKITAQLEALRRRLTGRGFVKTQESEQ